MNLRNLKALGAAILLAVLWGPCRPASQVEWESIDAAIAMTFPAVETISPDELAALMQEKEGWPILLDARAPEEFDVSHLRFARSAPTRKLALRALGDTAPDALVVVYCSVGYRSAELAEQLQEEGFSKVLNLRGSIFRWANENRPLYRGSEQVRVVHPYEEPWSLLLAEELRYEPH